MIVRHGIHPFLLIDELRAPWMSVHELDPNTSRGED